MKYEELLWAILSIIFFGVLGIIFFPFIVALIGLGVIYLCILFFVIKAHAFMHSIHFCPLCGVFPSFLKKKISTH